MNEEIAAFIIARLDEGAAFLADLEDLEVPRVWMDSDGCVETDLTVEHDPSGEPRLPNHHNMWSTVFDPNAFRLDIRAKRLLVEFWSLAYSKPSDFPSTDFDRVRHNAQWTLKMLALPYVDHPDYRQEWTP